MSYVIIQQVEWYSPSSPLSTATYEHDYTQYKIVDRCALEEEAIKTVGEVPMRIHSGHASGHPGRKAYPAHLLTSDTQEAMKDLWFQHSKMLAERLYLGDLRLGAG